MLKKMCFNSGLKLRTACSVSTRNTSAHNKILLHQSLQQSRKFGSIEGKVIGSYRLEIWNTREVELVKDEWEMHPRAALIRCTT
jgi:hypothetical protein